MIDPRIAETEYHVKRCVQEDELARSLCTQPWAPYARDAIARLLGRFLASLDGDTEDIPGKLRDFSLLQRRALDDLDLPEQSKQAIHAILHDLMHHDGESGEARIIGLALGDALLARARFERDIVPVALLTRHNYLLVIGFTEATRTTLASTDHRLWGALESLIAYENRLHEDPGHFRHKHRMDMLKGWQQETNIHELWHLHAWEMSHLSPEVLSLLMAARHADAKRFLQMAEKLTFPTIASDMLYAYDIRYDFDHLLVLLESAPNILNDECNWNRNMMAPLLLKAVFQHLRDLGNPPGTAEPLAGLDEIRAKVRSILLVLLARPDGRYLCVNWLVYLLRPLHQAWPTRYVDTLIDECVVQLMSNGYLATTLILPPVQPLKIGFQYLKLVTLAGEDGERAYFHFFIALLLRSKAPATTDLREEFESLLVSARSQFGSSTQYKYCWQHTLVANLYLSDKEPVADRWRVAFDRFASMLRSVRLRQDAKNVGVPSLFLAGVGIAMIRTGTSPDAPPALAAQMAELWSAVFEAAFHAHICSDPFDTWAAVIEDLFRCYPGTQQRQGKDGSRALLTYIERLGTDDRLLTQAITALGTAGLDLREITEDKSLQGELEDRINTYLAWSLQFESRQLPAYVHSYWHTRKAQSANVLRRPDLASE
ncbi:hypothetical protein [Pseudomonas citronellolis]|uniref:hypothetical protein n=1 Tax=Pseudomonas citronellolis TaxID=53408 RepID=UPI0021BF6A2D|nr:hypothetical protein [Pseudomonas citronellolis]UXJ50309.1 hypothetical protein N5P21_20205 [Pseudomonas citronellolis]